ncbi:MAG: ROK family protein [Acidobacteria bacterium]|nr:ROK family protein [Acidobacteriota bacterium]
MILAVDIGGTRIKYGVMTPSGSFLSSFPRQIVTPQSGLIEALAVLLSGVAKAFPVRAAGISIAANVNREGVVLHATNLGMPCPVDLCGFLSGKLGIAVKAENDGNCAALAVFRFEEAVAQRTFVVITLGTGVGGGIICNGGLLASDAGAAAELGHIVLDPAGPGCPCGKRGCLEAYIGEAALVERYNREKAQPPLKTALEISTRLKEGDKTAAEVACFAGERLGRGMAVISDIISPDAFYIAGGVAGLGGPMLTAAEKTLSRTCFLRTLNRVPEIRPVRERKWLSLRGAGVLVL